MKRVFDLVFSVILLILLSPLFLVIGLLIRLDSPGEVVYKSKRIGRWQVGFQIYKFRTMHVNAEKMLRSDPELAKEFYKRYKLANDRRVTRIGKFLRRTGLDELPQLFNIFLGDMSFIGPRPTLPEERQVSRLRFRVRPGLTGLWQIKGKNAISYKNKNDWDEFYARKRNFYLDLMILAKTVPAIIRGKGFKGF